MTAESLISLAVLFIVIFAVVIFVLRWVQKSRADAARLRFPGARLIVPGANFLGQESHGRGQLRGNGTLVLTDSEVIFEMWLPRREFRIPISVIDSVEMVSSYLGKTMFRPLVKVNFRVSNGTRDSMAWAVGDVEALKRALESAVSASPRN